MAQAVRHVTKIRSRRGAGDLNQAERARKLRNDLAIYLLLALAVFAVYGQVRQFDFVNFDDPDYVGSNAHVRAGLGPDSLAWAFTSGHAANWIPLTWLSHMLDCQLFGLASGWHHLTNVLLHALSTLLLFAVLKRMTGAHWPSAFVAFVFGLHPLHVESVAWVAERKDVLSAFFWFLTLWVYLGYVERPGLGRYLLVLFTFCLGLMAKPMAVTLPFVLLLLDVWPLGRIPSTRFTARPKPRQRTGSGVEAKPLVAPVLREKIPLFALSLAASMVTYLAQQRGGAVSSLQATPAGTRLANAVISYVAYILKMLWPARLAAFYPFPRELPPWQVVGATLALVAISVLVAFSVRGRPYLAVGWLWYLGSLVPVIGLVEVGAQCRADRYTYVPLVGISIMIAWGAAEAFQRWPRARRAFTGLSVVVCAACLLLTWFQVQYWRSSFSLFQHALEVTSDNYLAHNNLGAVLRKEGRIDEAVSHFQEALRIRPRYADALGGLGEARMAQGRLDEAFVYISEAVRLRPSSAEAHVNLGTALSRLGKPSESETQYREAIRFQPDNAEAHSGLGAALAGQGQAEEAIRELREAVRIRPEYADAHYNLARLLAALGRLGEATAEFAEAVRLQPDDAAAHYNLGTALAAQGRMNEAVAEFSTAVRLKPGYAKAEFNLGIALANSERFDEAATHLSEALRIEPEFVEARKSLEYVLALRGQSRKQ